MDSPTKLPAPVQQLEGACLRSSYDYMFAEAFPPTFYRNNGQQLLTLHEGHIEPLLIVSQHQTGGQHSVTHHIYSSSRRRFGQASVSRLLYFRKAPEFEARAE